VPQQQCAQTQKWGLRVNCRTNGTPDPEPVGCSVSWNAQYATVPESIQSGDRRWHGAAAGLPAMRKSFERSMQPPIVSPPKLLGRVSH
jgi:hypothetical protein